MSGMAWVRILVGAVWLNGALEKTLNPAFPAQLERVLLSGGFLAQAPPFLRSFMQQTILPNAETVAQLVRFGELALGLAFVFGLLINPAALVSAAFSAVLFLAQGGPDLGSGLTAPEFLTINLFIALISLAILLSPSAKDSSLDTGLARRRPRLAPLLTNRGSRGHGRARAGTKGHSEVTRSTR
jgi:thiosulfate dehydrogenase [quinone] large subunit